MIKIALVGLGKIAHDQHLPVIARGDAFELVAAASRHERLANVPMYPSIEAMLQAQPAIDAIAICTPPQVRYDIARIALEHGCHVLLEKPPCATLSEAHALVELARARNLTLFATWHSREAAAVASAREWLVQKKVRAVQVQWKEDVRVWHPGQQWIWRAGGFGVFDPGINALSILTHILPGPLTLKDAELSVPANCDSPIAARCELHMAQGTAVQIELDFLHTGTQIWNIDIATDQGTLQLSRGGAVLSIDGEVRVQSGDVEYSALYARLARLISEASIDVDLAPLRLVADAFLVGRRREVAAFHE